MARNFFVFQDFCLNPFAFSIILLVEKDRCKEKAKTTVGENHILHEGGMGRGNSSQKWRCYSVTRTHVVSFVAKPLVIV